MKKVQPTCYLICGFLGAGKTTYAKRLASETGAIHLNPDEWCMNLFTQSEYEQHWNACFSKTIDFLWEKAKDCAGKNQSVIFDMGFWTKESRQDAMKKATQLGFLPVIHYVYASEKVLKERIAKRKGTIAESNLKHFDELKKQFEIPDATEKHIRIDTTEEN